MDNMPFPAAFLDDVPQVCMLCGIYFNNALSLQYHMRLHAGPQDPNLFDARPPPVLPNPVPTTAASPTNGSLNSSLGSNISPVTPNSTMPKQDFELGLEFLNSLTQMYANPNASRENKEKGYDFRYEPNTTSQPSLITQDNSKPCESLKYSFDDFYNSPGAEALDKKFESVLNYELSKDNGMHFGNHKEPLESILDEPFSDREKAEKLVDSVSQMYHNELRNELDNISNDSVKSDEQNKFTNIKIPDFPDSPKQNEETKIVRENSVRDQSSSSQANKEKTVSQDVSQIQVNDAHVPNIQANDSPSFEDEIPKVGKFMKIRKYFQSQEMRKKERSSVEKSEPSATVSQNGEKVDKSKEAFVTNVDKVPKKNENISLEKTGKNNAASEIKMLDEKAKDKKSDSTKEKKEEASEKEEIGINLRSLRKRPNRVEEPEQKKLNARKKANPKRCVRKEQVEEKLKQLGKENIEDKKEETETGQKNENSIEIQRTKEESKDREDTLKTNSEKVDVKETGTPVAKQISPEKEVTKVSVIEKNPDTVQNVTTAEMINTEPQQLTQETEIETPKDPFIDDQKEVIEDLKKSYSEGTDSEVSDDYSGCVYGQESVEPLKIKIWKIKKHKKKKHKKKKKKYRKERSSTESLNFADYTPMTDNNSADIPLEKHIYKKSKRLHEKKHACEYCGQGFGQKCDLRKHIMIHTGERPWVCEVCEKTFQRKTDLVKHTRIHTGEKPYECEYCGKKVSDKSQLNVHRRLHTGDRPYQCDICSKGCITSSELTRHRQTHFSDRPWKCEVCQKGFKLKECLAMHMKIHNGTQKYQCAKCGLGFDRESKLEHHVQLHEVENPYMCRECGREFDSSSLYANHIKSHKKELRGPFSCDYCGKLYEYKSNLDSHVRTHTGEKPFICELCNSSYSLKGNLKHHMKVQHGDTLYKCEICSETFHLKRDLINHSKIHPEDQLYCHYCDKRFWDQDAADTHREQCSARKSYDVDNIDNPGIASILDSIDDEFAKSYTPQGKIESPPPTRDKKELDKIYEFDDSDSETKTKHTKVKVSVKRDLHLHMSPRSRDLHTSPRNRDSHMSPRSRDSHTSPRSKDVHLSPRNRDHFTHLSPKGAKRSRDPEIPKPLTISALLNSPPMNKKQKSVPQPKSDKVDPFQGVIDKSAVLANKDDDLDLLHHQIDATVSDTLPNLTVSDKTDLFENIIDSADLGQSKENASVTFTGSLTSTTESSVFSSKDTIDSLLSSAPVINEQHADVSEQHSNLPVTSNTDNSSADRNFVSGYNWKNDLMPSMDYVNSLLMKSLNGPSAMTSGASCNKFDADDSLSKFNLDYLNPLIMKTLNPDLKFDTNENLQKSTSFYTTSTSSSSVFSPTSIPSSSVFSPPTGAYSYKPQFSAPSDSRVDTYPTVDYTSSRTLGMPNIEKLAMDYLYQSSVASEKHDFQQKFGLTGKTDASVPLPSFNYLNTVASNQDTLNDALDMSAFSGLPSMSAFTRNSEFNAHLAAPSSYGALDITKSLPSGEKLDDTAALLSNFEYGT